jgi:hypothetical protein
LKLLQLRDEATGEYLDIYTHPLVAEFGVTCAQQEPLDLITEIANRYDVDEIHRKVGELKFNSLEEFLNYLK